MTIFTKEQLIAKAREQIAFCHNTEITGEGRAHINQCSALFEIALAALTAKPFMYGIEDCDGMAYFAEHCVSSNPAHLSDELQTADDESGEGAKVIPLYRLPEID
ncbi:hypothetical protein OGX69_13555 [Citrobacter sp. Cb130]|uniref:hypothetical protein n=1 Tax=Citrobacter sp. Cb130 TaxID=2985033 RepID=UPI002575DB19|nr:hypothetical protein [Citrobacter sp. Cb130]EIN0457399.1 hypothetical protein [Escherichia coli]MDM3328853.1 hypothetical protein [Citrobacter sp. Cb130]